MNETAKRNPFAALEVEALPFDGSCLSPTSSDGGSECGEGTPQFCSSVCSITPRSVSPMSKPCTPAARRLAADLDLTPTASPSPCRSEASVSPADTVWRNSPMPNRKKALSEASLSPAETDSVWRNSPVPPNKQRCSSPAPASSSALEEPASPHATPVAHATLSPMSHAKASRRLQRLQRDDKVAVAFSVEDWADDKNDSTAAVDGAAKKEAAMLSPGSGSTNAIASMACLERSLLEGDEASDNSTAASSPKLTSNDRGACLLHRQRAASMLVPLPSAASEEVPISAARFGLVRVLHTVAILAMAFAAGTYIAPLSQHQDITEYLNELYAVSMQGAFGAEADKPRSDPLLVSAPPKVLLKLVSSSLPSAATAPPLKVSLQSASMHLADPVPKAPVMDIGSMIIPPKSPLSKQTRVAIANVAITTSTSTALCISPVKQKKQKQSVTGIYHHPVSAPKRTVTRKITVYKTMPARAAASKAVATVENPSVTLSMMRQKARSAAKDERVSAIVQDMRTMMYKNFQASMRAFVSMPPLEVTLKSAVMDLNGDVGTTAASTATAVSHRISSANVLKPTSLSVSAPRQLLHLSSISLMPPSSFYTSKLSGMGVGVGVDGQLTSRVVLGSVRVDTAPLPLSLALAPTLKAAPVASVTLPTLTAFSPGVVESSIKSLQLQQRGAPTMDPSVEVHISKKSKETTDSVAPLQVKLTTASMILPEVEGDALVIEPLELVIPLAARLKSVTALRFKRMYQGPLRKEPLMPSTSSNIIGNIDLLDQNTAAGVLAIESAVEVDVYNTLPVQLLSAKWELQPQLFSADYAETSHARIVYVGDQSVPLMPVEAAQGQAQEVVVDTTESCPRAVGSQGSTSIRAIVRRGDLTVPTDVRSSVHQGPARSVEMIRAAMKAAAIDNAEPESVSAFGLLVAVYMFFQTAPVVPVLGVMKIANTLGKVSTSRHAAAFAAARLALLKK